MGHLGKLVKGRA